MAPHHRRDHIPLLGAKGLRLEAVFQDMIELANGVFWVEVESLSSQPSHSSLPSLADAPF